MFGLWKKSRICKIELPRSKLTGYQIAMRIYPKFGVKSDYFKA